MTREEAIKALQYERKTALHENKCAIDMAIKALEQEPCDDCVSRQAVLALVAEYQKGFDAVMNIGGRESMKKLADDIKLLNSSVNQKQGWIPVSERLPERFRFVNCTCHSLIDDREDWVVETCYVPQPPNSPYSDWGIPMLKLGHCEVVAWMYRDIPEPYKAESEK